MKTSYTITSAKAKLSRCGMAIKGKNIIGRQPGIAGWGAYDYLRSKGYSIELEIPKMIKENIAERIKRMKWQ